MNNRLNSLASKLVDKVNQIKAEKFNVSSQAKLRMALLASVVLASASYADTSIVDNLTGGIYTTRGSQTLTDVGQAFTMPGTGDTLLSSITLSLNFTRAASATVYLYSASAGLPTGSPYTLGTVSAAGAINNDLVSLLDLNYALTLGASYAIVVDTSSAVSWNYTASSSASGGTAASLPGNFYNHGGPWQSAGAGEYQQMNFVVTTPTPEPSTLALAGLGGLGGFLLFRRRQ